MERLTKIDMVTGGPEEHRGGTHQTERLTNIDMVGGWVGGWMGGLAGRSFGK